MFTERVCTEIPVVCVDPAAVHGACAAEMERGESKGRNDLMGRVGKTVVLSGLVENENAEALSELFANKTEQVCVHLAVYVLDL